MENFPPYIYISGGRRGRRNPFKALRDKYTKLAATFTVGTRVWVRVGNDAAYEARVVGTSNTIGCVRIRDNGGKERSMNVSHMQKIGVQS